MKSPPSKRIARCGYSRRYVGMKENEMVDSTVKNTSNIFIRHSDNCNALQP